jgi:rubrerythrin
MPINRRQFLFIFSSIPFLRVTFAEAQSKYSETIAILQKAYTNEIQAHRSYLSYAEKANLENYPGLAHFFYFFAISESIHARNFKHLLPALGVQGWEPLKPEIKVFSTKVNLKRALDSEMLDIDQRYPQFIEKVKPENYESALQNLNYAWETEKQHRDLILKMQSGTGMFFGILAKKIEETSFQCFLCQVCGSTVMKLPDQGCPICKNPVSAYKEVERQKQG